MQKLLKTLQLENHQVDPITVGRSDSDVYKLTKDNQVLYLKIGSEPVKDLAKILLFLETTTLNTPKLLSEGRYGGRHYVLMSECKGLMTYEIEPHLAVKVLAQELKLIHSLDVQNLDHYRDVSYYKKLLLTIDQNTLSDEDQKFVKQMDTLSIQEDLVFTHGDYCLPNILYENGLTSIIDLDYAGISFRYLDILDCMWSLEYNFKDDKYGTLFLQEYGITELDPIRVSEIKTIQRLLHIKGY